MTHLDEWISVVAAAKRFYGAVFSAVGVPIGGEGPGFFWSDELFISSADSPAASVELTGRATDVFVGGKRTLANGVVC